MKIFSDIKNYFVLNRELDKNIKILKKNLHNNNSDLKISILREKFQADMANAEKTCQEMVIFRSIHKHLVRFLRFITFQWGKSKLSQSINLIAQLKLKIPPMPKLLPTQKNVKEKFKISVIAEPEQGQGKLTQALPKEEANLKKQEPLINFPEEPKGGFKAEAPHDQQPLEPPPPKKLPKEPIEAQFAEEFREQVDLEKERLKSGKLRGKFSCKNPSEMKVFVQAVKETFRELALANRSAVNLRNYLTSSFPSWDHYFTFSPGFYENTYRFEDRTFSQNGVQFLVEYLKLKSKIDYPCYVLLSESELKEKMLEVIHSGAKAAFITRAPFFRMPHWTSFYIDASGDAEPFCLITDSIGQHNPFLEEILKQVQEKTSPPLKIYNLTIARQYDLFNCAIFALFDAIEYPKYQAIWSQFLLKAQSINKQSVNPPNEEENQGQSKKIAIDTLPLSFMRISQLEKPILQHLEIFKESQEEIKEFTNKWERNKRPLAPGKTENIFIAKKAARFEGLIWEHIIMEEYKKTKL